ncbi:MAG: XamI family restriction endonuclease [Rhizomicrobium sp.]
MKAPPRWDHTRLATEAAAARKIFRQERLEEPAAKWRAAFDRYQANFAMLLNEHGAINLGKAVASRIAGIFGAKLGDELRYMAGPPISADDLAVLADTTLATSVLRRDPDAAKRVVDIILQAFDPYRFPWLAQGREPTNAERMAAILASAAMLTRQRVQTDRANQGKKCAGSCAQDLPCRYRLCRNSGAADT